ncbi:MAG: DUF2061 domain-containing protein [Alcanivoracaceae bacterium]
MTKTVSFGIMHMIVAFTVVWIMTGSILIGGAVALVEPIVNTVAYHFHEKLWARRRRPSGVSSPDMLAA